MSLLFARVSMTSQLIDSAEKTFRKGASVNAYLILKKDDEILLNLRKNTGYCDGFWSLIAGHVEDGESATAAIIREAEEEIGIYIREENLQVVHVMHRQTNRYNIDIFFKCRAWEGELRNQEPEKCEALSFFSVTKLPENIIDYNIDVLKAVAQKEFYSERGWHEPIP